MSYISTVCGNISPNELGMVSMHDHIFYDLSVRQKLFKAPQSEELLSLIPENMHYARNHTWDYDEFNKNNDYDYTKKELQYFKKYGGGSIVECSSSDIRGDVRQLRRISEETGIHIIAATGMYLLDTRYGDFLHMTEDDMCQFFINEITNGIDGTGIRPGIVKAAIENVTELGDIIPEELISLRACARAASKCGYPLWVHTGPGISNERLANAVEMIIQDCQLPAHRIVICHMDVGACFNSLKDYIADENISRIPNYARPQMMLDLGVNIGIDTCGNNLARDGDYFHADDIDRLRMLIHFIKAGYTSQIVLGHDLFPKALGFQAGMQGYARIFTYILPKLRDVAGLTQDTIYQIFHGNAARILSID